MNTVSVVMPTYNAEKYLKEAIDSILAQTFTDFELLIVDDNSKDKTIDIIKSYQDPRIKLIEGPNKGIAAALNKGIREARGKYIARMDADDISLPDRFKKQVEFLEKHEDISLVGSWFVIFPQNILRCFSEKITYLDLLRECCIAHPTVMFKKEIFIKYKLYYDENIAACEDYDLWSRAIQFIKIANIPEVLLKYRSSDTQASKKTVTIMRATDRCIKQRMLDWLTDNKMLQNILCVFCSDPYGAPIVQPGTDSVKIKVVKKSIKYVVKLFGIFPIIKVRENDFGKKYYLFNFIKLLSIKYK